MLQLPKNKTPQWASPLNASFLFAKCFTLQVLFRISTHRLCEVRPSVLFCLSTNMLDHIDPAVVSRSSCVSIGLPGLLERRAWWTAHAKHLTPSERQQLATDTEGLSFRDLSQVAEKVERMAARKDGGCCAVLLAIALTNVFL